MIFLTYPENFMLLTSFEALLQFAGPLRQQKRKKIKMEDKDGGFFWGNNNV